MPERQRDKRPVQYFLPDQLLLICQHQAGLSPSAVLERLRQDPVFTSEPRLRDSEIPVRQIRTITLKSDRAFSVVPVFIGLRGTDLIGLVDRLDSQLSRPAYKREPKSFTVSAATPNWLSSSAPGVIGTGGPGAKPCPADPGTISEHGFKLPDSLCSLSQKQGVEVAILDTAPSPDALYKGFVQFHAQNPLLERLLGPNGHIPSAGLRVTYASGTSLRGLSDPGNECAICGHEYEMPDHGLFVAGIIHAIMPKATLHLIQVLNDYGVGSLTSIIDGLSMLFGQAAERQNGQRKPDRQALIVNMSFTVSIPLIGHPTPDLDWSRLSKLPGYARRMASPIELLCRALYDQGVSLVAAAGNDSGELACPQTAAVPMRAARVSARFPAAFASVAGVAALLKDSDRPAAYSNLADRPSRIGMATFGGAKAASGFAEPDKSVLGLYVGKFPDRLPNKTGWAWWAGTSFATPIIAGALARLRGAGNSRSRALSLLYAAEPGETPPPADEEVLMVSQE